MGSSSNANNATETTTTTTTRDAALQATDQANIVSNDNSDDITALFSDNDIPDIIVLNARGEPEVFDSPANDAASSLLNS